jgi:hypothetical protein
VGVSHLSVVASDDSPDSRSTHAGFTVVPYEPRHLREIALQPHQEHLAAFISARDHAERVADAGPCWTALVGRSPVGCGGFQEPWAGRAIAWAVLARAAGPWMLPLTRAVHAGIAAHPAERIEAQTAVDFLSGLRWAFAIGFRAECRLERFYRGQDYWALVYLKPSVAAQPVVSQNLIL